MAGEHIEGRNAVLEALRAGTPLKRVVLAAGLPADRALDEISRLAAERGVRVDVVPRRELDRASERGAHQGVLAEAEAFRFAQLEDVVSACEGDERALIVVLDHVTDPGNLGAIVRTAEVAGAAAVVVPNRRSAAVTPAAYKAAAGAFAYLPLVQEPNVARVLERLKQAGFWVAGASEKARDLVWDAPLEGRIALVMGSEGEGLARLTRERCDFLVRLPQAGRVGSLNVAQAASVLIYEWVRRGSATP